MTDLPSIAARLRSEATRRMPLILALDVATSTGYAYAKVGETPVAGSTRFGDPGDNENLVFASALDWISMLLDPQPRPDIVVMEALLPPDAMRGDTSRAVRDRLAGLHGIMRGVAKLRGIGEIATATVGDVRAHFIGDRRAKRVIAKRETMRQCIKLGWRCKDDNAADALAVWSYTCAIIDPKTALRVSPLFNFAQRAS